MAYNLEHAQQLCRTRYFWWISYLADYSDFDFDYEPLPWQSEYTHVWPNQHHEYSGTYLVPAAGKIKYHFHSHIVPNKQQPESFDILVDSEFDFTWAPHPHDPPYIYVFGNQWYPANIMPTVEYYVPGATERKYMDPPRARLPVKQTDHWHTLVKCEWDYSWVPDPGDPPLIYVFGNQWWPAEKMSTVEYHVPGATERKYMSWPRAQLLPDQSHWIIPDNIAHEDIDFSWVPDPGEPAYIYQFATQHQKTGGPVYTISGATEVKYLAELKIRTVGNATAVYEIDHLDGNAGIIPNIIRCIRYFDNYRDTLIRLAKSIGTEHEYVWICSSICDYTDFDFTWHPEQWQSTMLHVFASDEQKFGDTFFMHVPTFAEYAERKALLEWYDLNFVKTNVRRRPIPIIQHGQDSHVDVVKTKTWKGPLALFVADAESPKIYPAVNLWRAETKTLTPLDPGANAVIVPRAAVLDIKTQLYDYAYIDKTKRSTQPAQLQDVIFISYDEPEAEVNWKKLKDKCARAKRVHGIEGMENALAAAAELSSTPWYFCVFGKTELYPGFEFAFQPDYFQQPKHYIFHSENRVNKLVYGEMAIIMYNCNLILDNRDQEFGLDYTLSFPHEVIPIISTYGNFDTSPYHTWRTAFREVSKLYDMQEKSPSIETEYRINIWETVARGDYAEWALTGARDGRKFYQQYKDDFAYRKNSFNWQWLRNYFSTLYGKIN